MITTVYSESYLLYVFMNRLTKSPFGRAFFLAQKQSTVLQNGIEYSTNKPVK